MEQKFKVGNFFAELRKEKGLTQFELAEKINVTDKAVSKWENGKCLPEMEQLKKLAKLYNITIDELILGERVNDSNNIHEEVTVENYNKILKQSNVLKFSLISLSVLFFLSMLSVLFIWLDLSFALIYSCCLFAVSLILMIIIFGKYSKINSNSRAKKELSKEEKEKLIKSKKLNKICFIISVVLSVVILIFYIIGFLVEGVQNFAITNGLGEVILPIWLTIMLYIVWSISIVPAIMYVIMALKNPFFTGWMAGSFISIGWGAILIVVIPAPIFMVAYYISSIKLMRL